VAAPVSEPDPTPEPDPVPEPATAAQAPEVLTQVHPDEPVRVEATVTVAGHIPLDEPAPPPGVQGPAVHAAAAQLTVSQPQPEPEPDAPEPEQVVPAPQPEPGPTVPEPTVDIAPTAVYEAPTQPEEATRSTAAGTDGLQEAAPEQLFGSSPAPQPAVEEEPTAQSLAAEPLPPAVTQPLPPAEPSPLARRLTPDRVRTPRPVPPPQPARLALGSALASVFLLLCCLGGAALGGVLFLAILPSTLAPAWSFTAPAAPAGDAPTALSAPEPAAEPPPRVALPPAPQPEPPAEPAEAPGGASAVPEGQSEFLVDLGELRKVQVRCTGGSAQGASPLLVPIGQDDACTVTAILKDRSRLTAVIERAIPDKRYRCFVADAATCEES